MMQGELTQYVERFNAYVDTFSHGDPVDIDHVELKRNHTLRVLENSRFITSADPGPDAWICLALLGALFHDTGRFTQYARYKTFSDRISVNHATLGLKVLKQLDLLQGEGREMRARILAVVGMHNRRFIPAWLDDDLRYGVEVVRDADKLDIMPVMLDHFRPGGKDSAVVVLHLKEDPDQYSPRILEQVRGRQLANYFDMRWVNDFKLLVASWVYDLNFTSSRQLLKQKGYLTEILDTLPSGAHFDGLKEQLLDDLDEPGQASVRMGAAQDKR